MSGTGTVLVLAKAPVPGRVKTRLCPPLSPEQAADVASAALDDTLAAARATRAARVVLSLDGTLDPPPAGVHVLPQRGPGLAQRLANAFSDAPAGPVVLVGSDTPQLMPDLLDGALSLVTDGPWDAALGLAPDGGWWALALREPSLAAVLAGIPTSRADTGTLTEAALRRTGSRVAALPQLRDVDTWPDALAVAALGACGRFPPLVRRLSRDLAPTCGGAA